ncbi:MAG: GatB/YqeY domain-containing protein [Candidatus Vogelbacteria bacterium]
MLHQQIKEDVKKAMLEKNPVKLNTIRGLVAACTNELVATKRKPEEMLKDNEVLAVIRRGVKQRQDSIEQFTVGGRQDLVKQETAELEILKTYLLASPTGGSLELSTKVIEKSVRAKMAKLKIKDKKDIGKLTGAVMKDLKGQADGTSVKAIIEKLLI